MQGTKLSGPALVRAARREASIFDVLRDYFSIDHPRSGTSYKDRCPFGEVMHSDGGLDKNWRTYPATNSSFCFDICGFMGPVTLIERKFEISTEAAAGMLAQRYGFGEVKSWGDRWSEIQAEQARREQGLGDPAWCVEALHTLMRQHPKAMEKVGDPAVQLAVEQELERLGEVMVDASEMELRRWFHDASVRVLTVMGA